MPPLVDDLGFETRTAATMTKSAPTTPDLVVDIKNQTLRAGQGSNASAALSMNRQGFHDDTTSEQKPTASSQDSDAQTYPASKSSSTSYPLTQPPSYPPNNTTRSRSSTNPHPQNYIQDPFAMEMTPEQRLRNELSSSSTSSSINPDNKSDTISLLPYLGGGSGGGEGEGTGVLATAGKYLREGKEKMGRVEEMVWKRIGEGSGE